MKYSELSHEAKELIMFIENNASYFNSVKNIVSINALKVEIDSACIQYKIDNCNVHDSIFSNKDRKQATKYIHSQKQQKNTKYWN